MLLHPFVGTRWLRSIGPFGPVTLSYVWPHGSDTATWQMKPGFTHPDLRAGVRVEVFAGGAKVWRGTLAEPGTDGVMHALGSWHDAQGVAAMTGATAPTTIPDTAIDAAIARAAVSWARPVSLSSVAWSGDPSVEINLDELLDSWAEGAGLRWYVDPFGNVRAAVDPTTPMWQVPSAVAGRGLTLDQSEYYGRIYGRYLIGTGSWTFAVAGTSPPEKVIDLTELGVITSTRANAEVQNRYLLSGARRGWADGLNLSRGQITTMGGTPAPLSMIQAGQMIRLQGVIDPSRDTRITSYVDVVIGESIYTEGEDQIQLKPVGLAPRNLADVLKVAVE